MYIFVGAGVYFNPELPKRPFQNSKEANLLCERPYFCKTSTNMTIGQYSEGVCTRNIDPHCGLEEGSSCCIETRDGENLPYVGGTYRNLTYCTGTQPGSGNPLFCNETEFKCRAFPADQCGRPKGPCSPGFNSQPQFKTIGGLQSLVITEEICQNNSTCSEPGYYCNMDTNSRLPWATCLPQPKACGGAGQICCPQPSGALICTDNTTYCASPSGKYLMPEASLCIPLLPCGEAGQACCPARGTSILILYVLSAPISSVGIQCHAMQCYGHITDNFMCDKALISHRFSNVFLSFTSALALIEYFCGPGFIVQQRTLLH